MSLPDKVRGERLADMSDERLRMVAHELSFLERERLDDAMDRAVSHAAEFLRHDPLDGAAFSEAIQAATDASPEWHAAMTEYGRRQTEETPLSSGGEGQG